MDPLLSLIKIFFEQKNNANNDESIDVFFDNGVSFPKFISFIFNIEKIPNTHPNPKNIFQKRENNDTTLKYLIEKDIYFKKLNPNISSQNERSNLLLVILSRLYFAVNIQEIIDKSNLLFKNKNKKIAIQSKKDLMNPSYILHLLNVLTDDQVKICSDVTKDNFYEIMSSNFKIAEVPFFINYDSIHGNTQDFFFIQIKLIFDNYCQKIDDIINQNNKDILPEPGKSDENGQKLIEISSVDDKISEEIEQTIENKHESADVEVLNTEDQVVKENSDNDKSLRLKRLVERFRNLDLNENSHKIQRSIGMRSPKNSTFLRNALHQSSNENPYKNQTLTLKQKLELYRNMNPNSSNQISNGNLSGNSNISDGNKKTNIATSDSNEKIDNSDENDIDNENDSCSDNENDSCSDNENDNGSDNENDNGSDNENDKDRNQKVTFNIDYFKKKEKIKYKRPSAVNYVNYDMNYEKKKFRRKSQSPSGIDKENIKNQKENENENKNENESYNDSIDFTEIINDRSDELYHNVNDKNPISINDITYRYNYIEIQENDGLLLTINYLAKKLGIDNSLNTFHEALMNDYIPNFVMKFLNINTINNVKLVPSDTIYKNKLVKQNILNIISVINFLKEKENSFKILIFNFETEQEQDASVILFFKTFLNTFYITKPREEMMERLQTFASNSNSTYFSQKDHYYSLSYVMKYLAQKLEIFDKNAIVYEVDITKAFLIYKHCLDYLSIPEVFTNDQWGIINDHKIYPDTYYYQIQLLFDKLDLNYKGFHIHELFYNAFNKINAIKIQRFDIMASSIKLKKSFYDLNKQISFSSNNNENKISNDQKNNEENDKINCKLDSSTPLKFLDRLKSKNSDLSTSKEDLKTIYNNDAFSYWNPPNDIFIIENEILVKKQMPNDIVYNFNRLLSICDKKLIKFDINRKDDIKLVKNPQKKHDFVTKLVKLFYYDETIKKWEFNKNSFNEFSFDKKIDIGDSLTPLIFFAFSNENDEITLNSNFLYGIYPNLDEDEQIFVYALCDKNLEMLNLYIDFNDHKKSEIKPIFLLLHIPKSKLKSPELPLIILQIYIYLFCISDLVIVIFNEGTIGSQILSTKFVYSITKKYELNKKNSYFINDDTKYIFDKTKTIFLINEINYNLPKIFDYSAEYNEMINGFVNRPEICIIDINNFDTYEMFLNQFNEIIISSNTHFSDIKQKFEYFPLANISWFYINIRIAKKKEMVKDMIENRYKVLKAKSSYKNEPQKAVAQLYEEIDLYTPKLDHEFHSEVQNNLRNMRIAASLNERHFYKFELNNSSRLNIQKIKNSIKNKHFISKDQRERIIRNHQIFLQNEFLDIIKTESNDASYAIIFDDNNETLKNQFLADKEKLNNIFQVNEDNIKKKVEVIQYDPMNDPKKKTNFVLKENENLKEIQVSVEIGNDLTSVIEQDF